MFEIYLNHKIIIVFLSWLWNIGLFNLYIFFKMRLFLIALHHRYFYDIYHLFFLFFLSHTNISFSPVSLSSFDVDIWIFNLYKYKHHLLSSPTRLHISPTPNPSLLHSCLLSLTCSSTCLILIQSSW